MNSWPTCSASDSRARTAAARSAAVRAGGPVEVEVGVGLGAGVGAAVDVGLGRVGRDGAPEQAVAAENRRAAAAADQSGLREVMTS